MTAPIVITGSVVGAAEVVQRLRIRAPEQARSRLQVAVAKLGYTLERTVRTNQLNGGVLKRRTGRLARSINTKLSSTANSATAAVGTNVIYGRIWELTGSREYVILPRQKRALYWAGAQHPVGRVVHPAQSPRPFLRPALDAMRPQIHETLTAAMRDL